MRLAMKRCRRGWWTLKFDAHTQLGINGLPQARTPPSAERPGLGCSLPGLAWFTRHYGPPTPTGRSAAPPALKDRPSQGFHQPLSWAGCVSPSAFGPPCRGFAVELKALRGPLAPRLGPPPKTRISTLQDKFKVYNSPFLGDLLKSKPKPIPITVSHDNRA